MRSHKLIRIFVSSPLAQGDVIALNKEQSHYLINVMRRQPSDEVLLFNGQDGEFIGEIISASKNAAEIKLGSQTRAQKSSPDITLLYAPVKNAKNEFIVQKATEMGVSAIQPVITKHTIKDKTNADRLNLVAIEAAEQCERLDVPQVREIADLDKVLPQYSNHTIILCDETGAGKPASKTLSTIDHQPSTKYAILIGPEGGFSEDEIKHLHSLKNVHAIGLGPRILRAETAIITALALCQNYLGDFDISPDFRG